MQGDGSQHSLEIRQLLKRVLRAASRMKRAREGGNGDNEGEGDEGARPDTPLFSRYDFFDASRRYPSYFFLSFSDLCLLFVGQIFFLFVRNLLRRGKCVQ